MTRVYDEGHVYEMENRPISEDERGTAKTLQRITFMKKVDGKVEYAGVTNEQVLEMMLDRMQYLQKKLPCRENAIVLTKIEVSNCYNNNAKTV